MPQIRLTSHPVGSPIPVDLPRGGRQLLPSVQFRCWARLPGILTTRDVVVDTGSPFTWIPHEIWQHFQPGTDFEWLPFPPGFSPPVGRTAGWNFRFRMVRLLAPISLLDTATEFERHNVIAQLTDGTPPKPPGSHRPAHLVVGLWGGVLDNTKLAITSNPQTGLTEGTLEF